ncbi:MAG: IS91 family transposase, partial [Burkholderiales bacterium]
SQHLHVHCLIAAGALSPAGAWVRSRRGFLFPVKALSSVFRGKFLAALGTALAHGQFALSGGTASLGEPRAQRVLLARLRAKPWIVYAKRPFAGPEQVLEYLGRYTHRVAISNERLVALDAHSVRFRYKDYAHGGRRRVMHLAPVEFLRRFAAHVLPRGFNRIRHYGLLANRTKQMLLAQARAALDAPAPVHEAPTPESVRAFWQRIAGLDIERCPHCHRGTLRVIATLAPHTHPPP